MIRVYLTNVAQYNAGYLVGQWVNLPMDEDELDKVIADVLGNDEEYFLTDWATDDFELHIHEYSNVHELNRNARRLEAAVEAHGSDVVKAVLRSTGSFDEAMNVLDDGDYIVFTDVFTERDLGMAAVDAGWLGDIPESLETYLDFDKIGHDLMVDGQLYEDIGVFIIVH